MAAGSAKSLILGLSGFSAWHPGAGALITEEEKVDLISKLTTAMISMLEINLT